MPKTVVLDEWHVTFRTPAVMSDAEVRAVRRVLTGKAFTAAVRRGVSAVVRERSVLTPLREIVGR
jgi:hypothetical protein